MQKGAAFDGAGVLLVSRECARFKAPPITQSGGAWPSSAVTALQTYQ